MQSSAITCSVLCIHYISFNLYNHLDIYFMMLNPTKTLALSAYSRKKTNRGAEDILFWKLPWKFYICDNTLRTSWGNKLAPLEILHKVVWHLLEIEFQGQKPRPMEILHQLKLILELPHVLSLIPVEIPCPHPTVWFYPGIVH